MFGILRRFNFKEAFIFSVLLHFAFCLAIYSYLFSKKDEQTIEIDLKVLTLPNPSSYLKSSENISKPLISKTSEIVKNKDLKESKEELQNPVAPVKTDVAASSSKLETSKTETKAGDIKGDVKSKLVSKKANNTYYDRSFGSSDGPSYINRVTPTYPHMARKLGKQGSVVFKASIDKSGKLTSLTLISSSYSGFNQVAEKAIRASSFRPAKLNGEAINSKAEITIEFALT